MRLAVRDMFPPNAPSYTIVTGCTVTGSIGQADAVAAMVERTMEPAPERNIEDWLAELSTLVRKRNDDEFTEALRLEAYAGRLRNYPADVARAALLERKPFWTFWPDWNELETECERLVSARRAMLFALRNPREPVVEQPRERVVPERANAILAAAGFTPKRFAAVAKHPMAGTSEELEKEPPREPHWSETASPDDPRWDDVRRAREGNPLIQQALAASKRVEAAE